MRKNKEFGEYLEQCRGSTTIQHLADIYGCTRVYMWDILHGNVNPPQDFYKVENIANELKLHNSQKNKLYDKTALKNDIPIDIKQIIIDNPNLIVDLREKKEKGEIK